MNAILRFRLWLSARIKPICCEHDMPLGLPCRPCEIIALDTCNWCGGRIGGKVFQTIDGHRYHAWPCADEMRAKGGSQCR